MFVTSLFELCFLYAFVEVSKPPAGSLLEYGFIKRGRCDMSILSVTVDLPNECTDSSTFRSWLRTTSFVSGFSGLLKASLNADYFLLLRRDWCDGFLAILRFEKFSFKTELFLFLPKYFETT